MAFENIRDLSKAKKAELIKEMFEQLPEDVQDVVFEKIKDIIFHEEDPKAKK